ncbi:MAG: queuosine precursor transporter [Lachnospiraceae bacterium]
MSNELLLVINLVLTYLAVVLFYRFMGRTGLYLWTALATILANIEVLILIDAFGMQQTLGNILFASTFLVTDILSEMEGRKYANQAVRIGIVSSIVFVCISQYWLLYQPSEADWAMPAIKSVFSNIPRLIIVSGVVYAIVQMFDVSAYHLVWKRTTEWFGDSRKGLWIRNNASTLLSQLLNTVLFTFGAFYGVYSMEQLLQICLSSYVICIVTSILDTPAVYVARRLGTRVTEK